MEGQLTGVVLKQSFVLEVVHGGGTLRKIASNRTEYEEVAVILGNLRLVLDVEKEEGVAAVPSLLSVEFGEDHGDGELRRFRAQPWRGWFWWGKGGRRSGAGGGG